MEYAQHLLLLFGAADAAKLYARAAKSKPLDATERLDVEAAREALRLAFTDGIRFGLGEASLSAPAPWRDRLLPAAQIQLAGYGRCCTLRPWNSRWEHAMKPGLCLISADAVQSLAGDRTLGASPRASGWSTLATLLASLRLRLARLRER